MSEISISPGFLCAKYCAQCWTDNYEDINIFRLACKKEKRTYMTMVN